MLRTLSAEGPQLNYSNSQNCRQRAAECGGPCDPLQGPARLSGILTFATGTV